MTQTSSQVWYCPPDQARLRVGSITGDFTRFPNSCGESTLGNLLADQILWASRQHTGATAEFGVTSVLPWQAVGAPTGDLWYGAEHGAPGTVTMERAWAAAGFGVLLATDSMLGIDFHRMLEAMWSPREPQSYRPLSVSANVLVEMRPGAEWGHRIISVKVDGVPMDLNRTYRVAGPAPLLEGRLGYPRKASRDLVRTVAVQEAFVSYLRGHPGTSPAAFGRFAAV